MTPSHHASAPCRTAPARSGLAPGIRPAVQTLTTILFTGLATGVVVGGVRVEGNVELHYPARRMEHRYSFEVWLDGTRWRIDARPVAVLPGGLREHLSFFAAGDSRTVYAGEFMEARMKERYLKRDPRAPGVPPGELLVNDLHIVVHTNSVPNREDVLGLLWLALCSGSSLRDLAPPGHIAGPISDRCPVGPGGGPAEGARLQATFPLEVEDGETVPPRALSKCGRRNVEEL
ncbi:MAG: hypothetical protein KatS3mg132_248 [Limisphaera sp.]|nr:MAG: hypothetical protein KatS3mg132_248 [Limisphaera sp.]